MLGAAAVMAGFTISIPTVIEPWWNSSEYALEALSQYDKPRTFRNIKEREEIIYWLDEIFEEHASDFDSNWLSTSDKASKGYLFDLEKNGYSIMEGAEVLEIVGENYNNENEHPNNLKIAALNYLEFIKKNNLSPSASEIYLKLAKTTNFQHGKTYNYPNNFVKNAIELFNQDLAGINKQKEIEYWRKAKKEFEQNRKEAKELELPKKNNMYEDRLKGIRYVLPTQPIPPPPGPTNPPVASGKGTDPTPL